jgi:phosphoadenosine phosphosulfate reductase
MERLTELRRQTGRLSPPELLLWAMETFGDAVAFATSLGMEDQVITAMIAAAAPSISIFTLDTGRLFEETYRLMDETRDKYGVVCNVYFPDAEAVESMVAEQGINLFYRSVDDRKLCCGVRKVEPLRRALAGLDAWICGLRRDQSTSRSSVDPIVWDEANGLYKISPLYDWSASEVREYIEANDVPYNPLHDRGFLSIGCAPCTRAVKAGEDPRSGRWWWESDEHRECGLHHGASNETSRQSARIPVARLGTDSNCG